MDVVPNIPFDGDQSILSVTFSNIAECPTVFSPSAQMSRIVMSASQYNSGTVSDDDNSTVISSSFSALLYHEEVEEDDGQDDRYDDTALLDLIAKLRGGNAAAAKGRTEEDAGLDFDNNTDDDDDDEDMTDDVIAKHLKALTKKTAKKRPICYGEATEEVTETLSDEISILTFETGALGGESSDEESDEESDDEEAYEGVDDIMKKLVSASGGYGHEDHTSSYGSGREWLEHMSQQGECDYVDAPQTISSKKQWLVNLATELMEEDSDNNEVDVETVTISAYKDNVQDLAKESERAAQLMANPTVEQQVEALTWKPKPKPKLLRKAAAPVHFASPEELLKRHADARPKPGVTQATFGTTKTGIRPVLPLAKQHRTFSIIYAVSEQPNHLLARVNKPTGQQDDTPSLVAKVAAATELPNLESASTAEIAESEYKPMSPSIARDAANENTTVAPAEEAIKDKPNMKVGRQNEGKSVNPSEIVKKESIKRSQQSLPEKKAAPSIVIPCGFPPYPGYGPKWPWHPNSPRAPSGYRECYMHHMGVYYSQYVEYLQTRASSSNIDETKSEEILRSSLSGQTQLKMASYRRKNQKKVPRQAVPPPRVASNPGRARNNCDVPVVLKKIEEGFNSSSESSAVERKIWQVKTKPNVLAVGTIHKRSKGKKGKIVVVSGKELDKRAKEERTLYKSEKKVATAPAGVWDHSNQVEKSRMTPPGSINLKEQPKNAGSINVAKKKSRKTTFPEQPTTAIDEKCCCIIM